MDPDRRARLEEKTRYEPSEVEGEIFERWEASGAFHPEPEGTAAENYSVAIPPPNVTGSLHMGHALNGVVQDTLVRVARMRGRRTKWILGTDHAGIATQTVVERELRAQGTSRTEIGREAFEQRAWEWREEYGSRIVEQFKRLGASCDYESERFTLDSGYVRAVYRVFRSLYEKGHVYRDNRLVNWDPGSHSAISDLEVEMREVTDELVSIDYPIEGEPGRVVTVATVRPETMLADTAVAVHPDDSRYRDLVGRHALLPLAGRRLPIIADEHVDPDFGTGALKITPGHDPNDFEIGRRHGLEELSAIGEDGRITAVGPERFRGMDVEQARQAVTEALRAEGLIRDSEAYRHSVPYSHRSGERIEPLISLQWFCRMDELARPATEAVREGRIRFVPERWAGVYLDWMEAIRPWCISRQLWWGHRLPVWYGPGGEEVVAESAEEARVLASDRGLDPDALRQEEDVLDTWFSSALWPYATLGWPESTPELEAFYPTNVLSTARDIIYLWVARMIMTGLEFTGEVPFHDVYIHSVIQAPDGRRMSKSLGTGVDPLEVISAHGADALRFGLLAMSSTQDVRFSQAKIEQGRDLANKMWNASRLILLNVADVPPAPLPERDEDRWILSRLERSVAEVSEHLDAYDFSRASLELYRFFWSELCDWYLELAKPRLYEGEEAVSATLLHVLGRTLALAHPIMPFVTEEVHAYLPGAEGLLLTAPFPEPLSELVDEETEARVEGWMGQVRALRRWRELAGVPPRVVLSVRASDGDEPPEPVARLARVAFDGAGGEAVAQVAGVEIMAGPEVDAGAVEGRLAERREVVRSEIERAERKLGNPGFVEKAPRDVVDAEREKLEAYRAELAELDA